MKLGIVGLPNVGKSTLFNALTNAGAQAANYAFCTIEPNVGMVAVPYARLDALATLLALHTDFSVCDTYDRLAKVHPIAYSGFSSVLVDNAANSYCSSHQAELARHCYLPAFRHFVETIKARMAAGDRTPFARGDLEEFRTRAMAMSIAALRLDVPRTRDEFNRVLDAVLSAAER